MMPSKPTFLRLPIYSIANYRQYYYFAGGGGGKTGIPNEILVYKGISTIQMNKQPFAAISTGSKICENMVVHEGRALLVCSENQEVVIYSIEEGGKLLNRLTGFQSDFSPKNATINAINLSRNGVLLAAGGDDTIVKFYSIKNLQDIEPFHQYAVHKDPIRNIDNNLRELFLSTDKYQVVVVDMGKKSVLRSIHYDQLQPSGSLIQSAYFPDENSRSVFIVHYLPRVKTFVSRQLEGDAHSLQSLVVAEDQCCQSAYSSKVRMLGVACGSGNTYMLDPVTLKKYGSAKKHNYIITGNLIEAKSGAYITGTPECSFAVQRSDSGVYLLLFSVVVVIIVMLMLSWNFSGEL